MKTRESTIQEAIRKELTALFPSFPVTVFDSPDDRRILCVRVFAVPVNMVPEVKASIRRIERSLIHGGDYILLPMVKNLEVTRQYYPEYLPSESPEFVAQVLHRLLQVELEPSKWEAAPLAAFFAVDYHMAPASLEFDLSSISCSPLRSRTSEIALPANEELALAA